jgi:hypothetical protein
MKRTDDRRELTPKKAADTGMPTKAASTRAPKALSESGAKKSPTAQAPKTSLSDQAPKKATSARAPKKRVDDRSLQSALHDRAAMEALAGRSLASLVEESAPKRRSLDNIDAIVSPRITDPTARVVKGATVRKCAQCSEDVWVAPSTFAAFKGRAMPPIWCAECAMIIAELNSPLRKGRPPGRA